MATKTGGHRMLNIGEVVDRVGLSKPTLYRQIKKGRFPRGTQVADRAVRWHESQIDAWMAEKMGAATA